MVLTDNGLDVYSQFLQMAISALDKHSEITHSIQNKYNPLPVKSKPPKAVTKNRVFAECGIYCQSERQVILRH